jgi:hypothetical protein
MDEVTFDVESLRDDLKDYYGTAMTGGFPMAVVDLAKVENASAQELIDLAQQNGEDLSKYFR